MASKTPSVVGIDASLTSTGLYFGPGDWVNIKGGKLRGSARLAYFYDQMFKALAVRRPAVAVIEGYAFGSEFTRKHRLGELGGVIRLALINCGVADLYEVPPSTLKKFFSGKGNCGKTAMLDEARRRDGGKIPNHDVADACALWWAYQDKNLLRTKCEHDPLK